jgi:hypothetical protein
MREDFLNKLIKALEDAITKKNGHTDLIHYLMLYLDGKDEDSLKRKKLRNKITKILPQIWSKGKDKEDRRRVQFNLDALNKLYTNTIDLCQKHNNNIHMCKEFVKQALIILILENLNKYYDIETLKNELNKIVSPPQRDERMIFGFVCSRSVNTFNLIDKVDNSALKQELEMINKIFNLIEED